MVSLDKGKIKFGLKFNKLSLCFWSEAGVGHSLHHPMVEGSSPAAVAGTLRDKMTKSQRGSFLGPGPNVIKLFLSVICRFSY